MPPPTVAAVPLALLDVTRRTATPDGWARAAARSLDDALAAAARGGVGGPAAPGLGAAVLSHLARSGTLSASAGFTGLALLVAGGRVGALVLGLLASGRPGELGPDAAADLLAGALGLGRLPGSAVTRPAVEPHAVASLAALLGDDVLGELARTHPHLVGPVDGMPIELRYEANRVLALASSDAAIRALGAPGRQLLYVDPGRGHAAEVLGDLLDTDHVAVVVPGMANAVSRFDTVLDKAEALRRAAADLDPPADVATIAWLGYDSPLLDVVLDDAALDGAPALAQFVDGLGAGGVAAATTRTVIGHSYGSVVTGFAMREGLAADAVAVTGSPGLGASSADELGETPIYALRAPGDVVSWSEAYGTDPTDADFGATRLDTGDIEGHSDYFDDGAGALRSLALVAADRADQAVVLEPSWFERATDVADDAHTLVVDAPVDAYQHVVGQAAGTLSDLTDATESVLPAPAAGAIDEVQDAAGAALELANRGVDLAQRLNSPDFRGDVIEDVYDWITG